MQSNKKITEIAKELPHGAKKVIATKAGVSYVTVSNFFKGQKLSFGTECKLIPVINEYLEIIQENKTAKAKLMSHGK